MVDNGKNPWPKLLIDKLDQGANKGRSMLKFLKTVSKDMANGYYYENEANPHFDKALALLLWMPVDNAEGSVGTALADLCDLSAERLGSFLDSDPHKWYLPNVDYNLTKRRLSRLCTTIAFVPKEHFKKALAKGLSEDAFEEMLQVFTDEAHALWLKKKEANAKEKEAEAKKKEDDAK